MCNPGAIKARQKQLANRPPNHYNDKFNERRLRQLVLVSILGLSPESLEWRWNKDR